MAYNENKPQATDQLKNSQDDILQNFQAIKTVIDINHETFGAAGQGKHTKVDLPRGLAPVAAGNDLTLFNMLGVVLNTESHLFAIRNGGGINSITEGTANVDATSAGWYRFPSGSLVKWGTNTQATVATVAKTFVFDVSANIPVFATAPIVFAMPANATENVTFNLNNTVTTTGFNIKTSVTGNLLVAYFAIGT